MGCGISVAGECDHFIFPQKFSSGAHHFVYADENDNVVGLLYTTPYIIDTPQAEIPDEDVVEIMEDNMLQTMELKKIHICDDSYSRCGQEYNMDDET